jgi:GNAT superfamily N-acetyltransferase
MMEGRVLRTPSGDVTVALAGASDLDGILALQRQNLAVNLPEEAAQRDGFVTVVHTRSVLERMHAEAPSIVARSGGRVVAYALTMPVSCRTFLPILEPMFAVLDALEYRGRPLREARFYVMGQICVAEGHRGQGLFEALYREHERAFAGRFDLLVTEVSCRNGRSLRAHEKCGFETLTRYRDATDEWVVIGLAFREAR